MHTTENASVARASFSQVHAFLPTKSEVDALSVITISRGCFERERGEEEMSRDRDTVESRIGLKEGVRVNPG